MFKQGDAVRVRDRKGRVTDGIIVCVYPEQWWGETDYDIAYSSPFEQDATIRITEQLLERHNGNRKKKHSVEPDGLTKKQRRKRIAEIKAAIEDYETVLDCDLASGNQKDIHDARVQIQRLKNELHCRYRKEAYHDRKNKISVSEVYGLGLI